NGVDYIVMWQVSLAQNEATVVADRVSAAGVILDGPGFIVDQASTVAGSPSVAWNGSNYFAAWEAVRSSADGIFGSRISAGGTVLDPMGIPIYTGPGLVGDAAIASNG